MNIKNKILSLAGIGATLSQLLASRALAAVMGPDRSGTGEWKAWLPDFGNFKKLDLATIVRTIIMWALIFSAVVAVIFIIWGGYQYVTSSGDAEKAGKGRATLINAIIGLVIIFIAYAIVVFVFGRINIGS